MTGGISSGRAVAVSNLQPPVSPSASASSPCPVFVHSAPHEGRFFFFVDSAWERQLDGLSQRRSNRKCQRICIFCVKTKKKIWLLKYGQIQTCFSNWNPSKSNVSKWNINALVRRVGVEFLLHVNTSIRTKLASVLHACTTVPCRELWPRGWAAWIQNRRKSRWQNKNQRRRKQHSETVEPTHFYIFTPWHATSLTRANLLDNCLARDVTP